MGRCLQFQFQSLPGGQRALGRECGASLLSAAAGICLPPSKAAHDTFPKFICSRKSCISTCDSPLQRQGGNPCKERIFRNPSSLRRHWRHQKRADKGEWRRCFCRGQASWAQGQGGTSHCSVGVRGHCHHLCPALVPFAHVDFWHRGKCCTVSLLLVSWM